MVRMAADGAPEDGLVPPVLRGDVAARGTGLAGVSGIDPDHPAASPRGLVVQHPDVGWQKGEKCLPEMKHVWNREKLRGKVSYLSIDQRWWS